MFSHVCVSASNLDQSASFYSAVLKPLGVEDLGRFSESAWGFSKDGVRLLVMIPRDGKPATSSNGGTIGFNAPDTATVDAFHAAGLASGGSDEGAPGPRFEGRLYAAYLRDPVGNKICACYWY